jgi:ribosomal protein L11 methylase PrmA
MNTCNLAHLEWVKILKAGDTVIDATVGNGRDTLAIAKMLQGQGTIIGYDIQPQALENAKNLFEKELNQEHLRCITLKKQSHETFDEANVKLIVYNLGYLPGGDKNLTTKVESTLTSLKNACLAINQSGMISVTCYPGHEEGEKEERAVLEWTKTLCPKSWCITVFSWANRQKAPSLVLIRRH